MLIGISCFVIFLFVLFQLIKEDFIFLRKGIATEEIFNIVFLSLPIVFFFSRIAYIIEHPSVHYINPLVFFLIVYFPGLSFAGAIIGVWIVSSFFIERAKIPTKRLLDMVSIAFLFSFSMWMLLSGIQIVFTYKLIGIEEIGRSMLGIAFCLFILFAFIRNKWNEGSVAYMSVISYCLLTGVSFGISFIGKKPLSLISLATTGFLFLVFVVLFVRNQQLLSIKY